MMQFGPSPASAIPKPASWPIWLLLTLAAAAIGYWMHSRGLGYYLSMISRMMIYGLAACSLNLILGYGGLVSFGHAAFVGVGAYTVGILITEGMPNGWLGFGLAMAVSALLALIIGAISLRTKGVYFIMVTLAFAQMAYYVVHDTPLGGGTDGIYLMLKPALGDWLDLDNARVLYLFTLGALVAVYAFLAVLLNSRFGRALAGIRVNEQRMRATGFSTYPYKLAAFVLSGGIAGLAGFIFAIKDGFVNPEMLSWHLSGAVLIMIILGGLGDLRGAMLGAFAYALLQEFFKSEAIFGAYAKHWHLGLGLTIIASVVFLPRGLVGLPDIIKERLMGRRNPQEAAREAA